MVSRRGGGGRRHRAPAVDETGKGDHDMGQETNTQAVRYAEAVADDDMLREDDLRRMRDEYCERRKLSGTVAADAQWADEPFDHWLAGLSAQPRAIDDASIAALVVGMTVTLSIRDALIMSLVAGDTCADKRTMMDFASRSHAPDVQSRMCRELQGAFFDERRRPDEPRCRAGSDMLVAMADRVPESFSVQPLAVLAYVMWWMGDSRAVAFALRCLMLDEDCSLAAIVCSAYQRGVMPAWMGAGPHHDAA